jgi:hypothetical protein
LTYLLAAFIIINKGLSVLEGLAALKERVFLRHPDMQAGPLPSWHEGPSDALLLRFVEAVIFEGRTESIPPYLGG